MKNYINVLLVAITGLVFLQPCYVFANPIIPHAHPASFLIDAFIDILVLLSILSILGVIEILSKVKILIYIFFVYINGMICDLVSVFFNMIILVAIDKYIHNLGVLFGILSLISLVIVSFILLMASNYFIAKCFIKKDLKVHLIVGVVVAIFTHPAIGLIFLNDIDYINFYYKLFGII